MTTSDAIRIPRLTTRGAVALALLTLLGVLAITAYLIIANPGDGPHGVVLGAVVAAATAVVLRSATWLDATAGTITWRRWAVLRTTVALRDATTIEVIGAGPQVLLRVRAGRAGGHVLLLVLSDHVRRSQAADLLTTLADTVVAHTSPQVSGTAVGLLRAQAKHVAAGGEATTSPLAGLARNGLARAAGGIGAAGGGLGNIG